MKCIHFGNKVIVNMNCTFLDNNSIFIGNNVMIAPDVKIYTATHSVRLDERMPMRSRPDASICDTIARAVTIEDGVWIGGGTVVLPGVTNRAQLRHRCRQRRREGHTGRINNRRKSLPRYQVAIIRRCLSNLSSALIYIIKAGRELSSSSCFFMVE